MGERFIYIKKRPNMCGYLPGCRGCPVAGELDQVALNGNVLNPVTYGRALEQIVGPISAKRHERYFQPDAQALTNQPKNPRMITCQANQRIGVALSSNQ